MAAKRNKQRKRRRDNKVWNLFRFLIEVLLLMVLAALLFLGYKYSRMLIDKISDKDTLLSESTEGENFDTYLFLFENEKQLEDICVLVSVEKETCGVRFVSLDTDIFLRTDAGTVSVKQIYQEADAQSVMSMLNMNLNLRMKDYVIFQSKVLAEMADLFAGVTVNLSESEADMLNGVFEMEGEEDVPGPGSQHLNGKQALLYCRYAYGAEGMTIMDNLVTVNSQIWNRAFSSNATDLNDITNRFLFRVTTSLSLREYLDLLKHAFAYHYEGYAMDESGIAEAVCKELYHYE